MQEIWVVEYSPEQDAIHIETLDRILEINRNNVLRSISTGYVPLYASEEREKAELWSRIARDILPTAAISLRERL